MCYLVKLLLCFHLYDQFPAIDIKVSANSSFFLNSYTLNHLIFSFIKMHNLLYIKQ